MTDIPRKFGYPDNIELAVQQEHWPVLFSDHYELGEKVHNFVYRAKSKKDGHGVAVKFASALRLLDEVDPEHRNVLLVNMLKEVDITNRVLSGVSSHFLMPCEGVVYDQEHGLGVVSPWFEGGSLWDVEAGRGETPMQTHVGKWDSVASIGIQVALALEALHAKGIIHRDLKPGNLFLESRVEEGKYPHIRLGDFGQSVLMSYLDREKVTDEFLSIDGLAQNVDELEDVWNDRHTPTNRVMATPWYASPEQAKDKKLTAKSDLFSLGTILYEAISGRRTFAGSDAQEIFFDIQIYDPKNLRYVGFLSGETGVESKSEMINIIMSLLIKDPERRGMLPDGRQMNTAHDVAKAIADCWKDSDNQEFKETLAFQIASKY